MAYSWTRVRRLIAQQTGLLHTSGNYTQRSTTTSTRRSRRGMAKAA